MSMSYNSSDGQESIRSVQERILVLLEEFDRICVKNNIEYALAFGTALGAHRHKGFIPWDDDVDVQIDEANYEKLMHALNNDLDDSYYYNSYEVDNRYNVMLPDLKIYMKGTSVNERAFSLRNGTEESGLFLDVFVMHSISPSKFIHFIHRTISRLLLVPIYCFSQIGFNPLRLKRLVKRYSKWYSRHNKNSEYTYLSLCWSHEKFKDIRMLKRDIFPGNRVLFEDNIYPVPKNIHAYLSTCYGSNYMTPPANMFQKPSHIKTVEIEET